MGGRTNTVLPSKKFEKYCLGKKAGKMGADMAKRLSGKKIELKKIGNWSQALEPSNRETG